LEELMATRKTPSRKTAEPSLPVEAHAEPVEAIEASPPEQAEFVNHATVETADMSEESLPENDAEESASPLPEKSAAEISEHEPRFHFFIIDAGWKSTAAKVIRDNFAMIREFQNSDPLYVLSREQSIEMIRANPDLIGRDPIILVHDLQAQGGKGESGYHGFRLCLGLIKKSDQALYAMQEFLRFVHSHRRSPNIEKDIKEKLHRKGMEGAIEILRSGAEEAMG
jgi:hypothetical protein